MTPEQQDAWWQRRTGKDAETVERGGTFYLPDNTDGPYTGPPPSRRQYSSPVWKVLFALAMLLLFIVVRAVAERS
ncbi:hypothetical protein ACIPRI_23650 [Variovorax sp. LARHSF232]